MVTNTFETSGMDENIWINKANEESKRYFERCFKASGSWPWDWLPRDFQPKAATWSLNTLKQLTLAIESACAPDSNMTVDDLRDFLANKSRERQAQRKNGRPLQFRMHSDCMSARKLLNNSSQARKATIVARTKAHEAYKDHPEIEAEDDDEIPNSFSDHMRRDMRNMSEVGELSDLIGESDDSIIPAPREESLPPGQSPPSTPKRPMMKTWEASVKSASLDDESECHSESEESLCSSSDDDDEGGVQRAESNYLFAINRDKTECEEKIWHSQKELAILNEEIGKRESDKPSINPLEVSQVLRQAIRKRDKEKQVFHQAHYMAAASAAIIEKYGERCSDLHRAVHNKNILKRNDAEKKMLRAEEDLKEMENLTQNESKKHQQACDDIAFLRKCAKLHEETINEEMRKLHVLYTKSSLLWASSRLDDASAIQVEAANYFAMRWATQHDEDKSRVEFGDGSNSKDPGEKVRVV
ncbi:hypothetical protein F53441_8492 [Fusarium austroafricanum]|uniref:Uncharacterized protein n=1 Tax=Fusarium austroafricanum TaxID=2364996 RepID=A0A8H4KDX0_9HYPO|nr:hypothetical protein F53441_8492 [Fusarium austroafricanum]